MCDTNCAAGLKDCNGACTDTDFNPAHCGECDHLCDSSQVCSAGACGLECVGGTQKCGNHCVDPAFDPSHCGECDHACGAGEICTNGVCAACPPGKTLCKNACVDLSTDAAHCGTCEMACPYVGGGDPVCVGGKCGAQCDTMYGDCDDSGNSCETLLLFDSKNCGACGNVCPITQICSSGTCKSCSEGQTACGSICKSLNTSVDCGACGNVCKSATNAFPKCVDGACSLTCSPSALNCDGDWKNGCEIVKLNDPQNCGACGNVCASGQTCKGACVTP